MIILKVTKNQGFTLCLEDTTFEKPQGVGQIDLPMPPHPQSMKVLPRQMRHVYFNKSVIQYNMQTSRYNTTKL